MAAYASQVAIVLPVGLEIGFYPDFYYFPEIEDYRSVLRYYDVDVDYVIGDIGSECCGGWRLKHRILMIKHYN